MPQMPQVTAQELVRFLKSQGFLEERQSGSHLTLWHEVRKISVTIPIHTGCDLRVRGQVLQYDIPAPTTHWS